MILEKYHADSGMIAGDNNYSPQPGHNPLSNKDNLLINPKFLI